MKLWVMRHAYAGRFDPDPAAEMERELAPEGEKAALAIAKAMSFEDKVPSVIFCSPFRRTMQTAFIVGKELGIQVNAIGDLAPKRPIEPVIEQFAEYKEIGRVMIVVHVDNSTPAFASFPSDDTWEPLVMAEVRRLRIDRKTLEWSEKWRLQPSDLGLRNYGG